MSDRTSRLVGLYAIVAAVAAVIVAPLLALSYFATGEGTEELEVASVAAWAEPARELADGLLTFASPDRVYATYMQVFAVLFPAVIASALVLRARRPASVSRSERWGWRIALPGYALFGAGLAALAVVFIWASPADDITDVLFLGTVVPGLLLAMIGSTVLGIGLIRAQQRPRVANWLLALAIPIWMVGMMVLGHNSLGVAPLIIAWGAIAWSLRREPTRLPADPATAHA